MHKAKVRLTSWNPHDAKSSDRLIRHRSQCFSQEYASNRSTSLGHLVSKRKGSHLGYQAQSGGTVAALNAFLLFRVAHTARLHARLLSCRDAPRRVVLSAAPQEPHGQIEPPAIGKPPANGKSFCRTAADNGPATAEGAAPSSAGERPRESKNSQGERKRRASAPEVLPATRYSQHAPCQLLCR